MTKIKYLLFLFLFSSCFENVEVQKPSTQTITFNHQEPFVPDVNNNILVANMPQQIVYIPNPDCNNQQQQPIDWKMTDDNEYIDITIIDQAGVLPGASNVYILANNNQKFILVMAQSPTETVPLNQETWTLKLNPNPHKLEDEICNTGRIYPAAGSDPWEHLFLPNISINNQWILSPPTNAILRNLGATVSYSMHLLNFPHCLQQ